MYKYDKYNYGIVMGYPRSGTTFLMKCLEAMPYSECVSENLLPYPIPHIASQSIAPEIYQSLCFSFLSIVFNHAESGQARSRYEAFTRWVGGSLSTQELLQALQRKRSIEHLIYKEPCLSIAPQYTYEALPNSRIVYIYRDGRDAADSLVRTFNLLNDEQLLTLQSREVPLGRRYDSRYVPWWVEPGRDREFIESTPYVRSIWLWKEMVSRCHAFFTRPDIVASGRVMLLKYEDLVREPLKYGTLVVNHLGGDFNPRLAKLFQQARTSSIGIYQKRDPQEIIAAEKIARQELELYGYLKSTSELVRY